jgi:outer membrane protein OmpA-like peptidoglycan-associated protein
MAAMKTRLLLPLSSLSLAAALLAGCAVPRGPTAPGAPAPGAPGAAAATTIASEQRRLADALEGTPVVVESTPEGRLRIEVPLEFSFDKGRVAVKPPLAAVLDRIATGLRQQPGFEVRIAAPADAHGAGGNLLGQDRAAATRDYLVGRGVPVTRFAGLTRGADAGVEVLVSDKNAR